MPLVASLNTLQPYRRLDDNKGGQQTFRKPACNAANHNKGAARTFSPSPHSKLKCRSGCFSHLLGWGGGGGPMLAQKPVLGLAACCLFPDANRGESQTKQVPLNETTERSIGCASPKQGATLLVAALKGRPSRLRHIPLARERRPGRRERV